MKNKLLKTTCAVFSLLSTALFALPQQLYAQSKEAYVEKNLNEKVMTFYYDDQKSSRKGIVYSINEKQKTESGLEIPAWSGNSQDGEKTTTKVVFDESFKDFHPISTDYWFAQYTVLKELKGIENLNTTDVTNMSHMFYHCDALPSVDLSHFNTEKVTDMNSMFSECASLTSLNLSTFDTKNVTDMNSMFNFCAGLTSLNLSNFNTAKVKDMRAMFFCCTGLTSLDLSKFNTENVTDMGVMFFY